MEASPVIVLPHRRSTTLTPPTPILRGRRRMRRQYNELWRHPLFPRCLEETFLEAEMVMENKIMSNLLKVVKMDGEEDCPVCLGQMKGDDVVAMECFHKYHKSCILKWLTKKNTCPVCRYYMLIDREE